MPRSSYGSDDELVTISAYVNDVDMLWKTHLFGDRYHLGVVVDKNGANSHEYLPCVTNSRAKQRNFWRCIRRLGR